MMKKQIIVITVFVLWFSLWIYSHGLTLKVEKMPPFVMVTSLYHGGSIITDAEVKVFFNDPKTEFQRGVVDKKGKFAFIPDREGSWFVRVDDGMGHRKTAEIALDTGFFAGESGDNAPVSEPILPGKSRLEIPGKEQIPLNAGKTGQPESKKSDPGVTGDVCIYCKILLGVVLIFAFTLIFYALKRKGENQRQR
jgi:hypothetical protein